MAILIKHAFVSAYASRLTINDNVVTNTKRRLVSSACCRAQESAACSSLSFAHVQVAESPNYSGITDNLGTYVCICAHIIARCTHVYVEWMEYMCVCISKNRRVYYSDARLSSNGDWPSWTYNVRVNIATSSVPDLSRPPFTHSLFFFSL